MAIERATPGESRNDREARSVQVAIYTRKSNDENLTGNVTSIDNQKAACRSYINIYEDKGWQEYPEAFDDPAESGKDLKRPAVQRLLKAVQEGRVQAVIVYKLDRLTRSSRDFNHLVELFERHGVAFVSATESLDTKSPQGRLMVNIMVQFAQYDRELDVERSKDFHLARARKGLWCAGLPPLGYDVKDKLLVVNEDEAALVRRIFNSYLECHSALAVAQELNRLGFRRKAYRTQDGRAWGGKRFDIKSVIRVLQRKVYIGIITNERAKQEFPGQHQPLVSPAVFEKAQELLKSHSRHEGQLSYRANKYGFRLKGLVRCGECQSAVTSYIRPKPKTGKVYLYYKCLAQVNGMPIRCSVTSIGAPKLEEFVIEKLAAVGWDRPLLERVVEKVKALSRTQVGPLEQEKRELDGRLNAVRQEIGNMIGLARSHGTSKEVAEEMSRLETAKKTLEARLHELTVQIGYRNRAVYDVDVIQRALQSFARFIYKLPIEHQVRTIRLLVDRVLLFKDRVRVELHELPIPDLQRALDVKLAERGVEYFESRRSPKRRDQKTTNGRTAVVESAKNWRGRQDHFTTDLIHPIVPSSGKTHFIASILFSWPFQWARITNGEKVVDEVSSHQTPPQQGGDLALPSQKFKSRRLRERRDQKYHSVDPEGSGNA
ncbi:MAG: recombinase family protein [Elusimicrobia bacterium]|nr:recombinase family protein [Elusimicrobiota bacterium]